MGDPFGSRDHDCWKCIISELRKTNQADAADALQDALEAPAPDDALRLFDTLNPHLSMAVDAAAQTCRFEGTCQ